MKKLISDELCSALCEQIGHEKYNANLYLVIAGFLKNKGLDNLGKHFEGQHDEETEHSKMIYGLLTDMNAPVAIPEISSPSNTFSSINEIADLYLSREVVTTNSLDAIKKLAIEQDNPVVEEFMREMITKQLVEYAEASDFMDKAMLTGNDWWKVMVWDLSAG